MGASSGLSLPVELGSTSTTVGLRSQAAASDISGIEMYDAFSGPTTGSPGLLDIPSLLTPSAASPLLLDTYSSYDFSFSNHGETAGWLEHESSPGTA